MKTFSSKSAHGATVPATGAAAEALECLVTTKTVAQAATVSPRTVQNWMRRRLIPFVRLSARCVRFHLPSVLAALRKLEIKSEEHTSELQSPVHLVCRLLLEK